MAERYKATLVNQHYDLIDNEIKKDKRIELETFWLRAELWLNA